MKRFLILTLIFLMLCSLFSCCSVNEQQPESTAQSTTSNIVQTTPAATIGITFPSAENGPQLPLISISTSQTLEQTLADDQTVLHEYIYPTMQLILPDGEIAEAVTLNLLNQIDATRILTQASIDAAKASYSGASWTPYRDEIIYSPVRIDGSILSLYGRQNLHSDGAHSTAIAASLNYDLTTGKCMKLGDLLRSDVTADIVCRLVVDALDAVSQDIPLYDDYTLAVEDRFAGSFAADENWYLNDTGLCFFFLEYDVAPYSAGVVVAGIPYDRLGGIMKDAYFPEERISNEGVAYCVAFDETDLDQFNQFAEVSAGDDGTAVLLYTDSLIYDLTVEIGTWSAGGMSYTPTQTLFRSHSLCAGDALVIQGITRSTLPPVRISYATKNGTQFAYLTIANDGSGQPEFIHAEN